jgi:GTP cyclohydrolase I
VLQPSGVAVIIEATHGCMSTRGVNQHGVSMVTKCWLGDFKTDPELRRELMASIHPR